MKKEVNEKEIPNFAGGFLRKIRPDNNQATIIALYGNLGAGKTTLVKEIAKQLGVKESVTSPSFTLMRTYDLDPGSLGSVITRLQF
jgi:tRNA threonylcarbamoyladenosine biosynthesis protein TsaE